MEIKKGNQVRVVDNGDIPLSKVGLIGKKCEVKSINDRGSWVRLKDGKSCHFGFDQLELVAPKRHSFNLDRALAGDAVVTRDGREVTEISTVNNDAISGIVNNSELYFFTHRGSFSLTTNEHSCDLFMLTKSKPSKPSKFTQIAELTAKVAEQSELIKAAHDFLSELKAITWGSFTKEGIEEMIGRLKG